LSSADIFRTNEEQWHNYRFESEKQAWLMGPVACGVAGNSQWEGGW